MKIITVDSCNCKAFNYTYRDGSRTFLTNDPLKAEEYFVLSSYLHPLYWGLHFNNKHVVNIIGSALDVHDLLRRKGIIK